MWGLWDEQLIWSYCFSPLCSQTTCRMLLLRSCSCRSTYSLCCMQFRFLWHPPSFTSFTLTSLRLSESFLYIFSFLSVPFLYQSNLKHEVQRSGLRSKKVRWRASLWSFVYALGSRKQNSSVRRKNCFRFKWIWAEAAERLRCHDQKVFKRCHVSIGSRDSNVCTCGVHDLAIFDAFQKFPVLFLALSHFAITLVVLHSKSFNSFMENPKRAIFFKDSRACHLSLHDMLCLIIWTQELLAALAWLTWKNPLKWLRNKLCSLAKWIAHVSNLVFSCMDQISVKSSLVHFQYREVKYCFLVACSVVLKLWPDQRVAMWMLKMLWRLVTTLLRSKSQGIIAARVWCIFLHFWRSSGATPADSSLR